MAGESPAAVIVALGNEAFSNVSSVTIAHNTDQFPTVRVFAQETLSAAGMGLFGAGGFGGAGSSLAAGSVREIADFTVYYTSPNEFRVFFGKTRTGGYVSWRVE